MIVRHNTKLFFLIGSPCSGKSTIIENLKLCYKNIRDISIGKELRNLSKKNNLIEKTIKNGDFLPEDYIFNLFNKLLENNKSQDLIIDGFPRTKEQLNFLPDILKKFSSFTFFISTEDENLFNRFKNRKYCSKCNLTYFSLTNLCPKNHILTKRIDDSETTFYKRIRHFKDTSYDILNFLSRKTKMFYINGNKNIENVVKDISNIISNL